MIEQWLPALGLTREDVEFMNVANYKTEKNRPLKNKEIVAEIPRLVPALADRIVITLGATAEKALQMIEELHKAAESGIYPQDDRPFPKRPAVVLNMPHPSGRNRLLNDREWAAQKLEATRLELWKAIEKHED